MCTCSATAKFYIVHVALYTIAHFANILTAKFFCLAFLFFSDVQTLCNQSPPTPGLPRRLCCWPGGEGGGTEDLWETENQVYTYINPGRSFKCT